MGETYCESISKCLMSMVYLFLKLAEESALFLLQHRVVGGFNGCEETWDVGRFDGHLHVENEGERADAFEGRGGHGERFVGLGLEVLDWGGSVVQV